MGMEHYDNLHLAMFSGKGGVGKTTLSCGFARRWARQLPDQRILLLSTDPAHSLGDVLQVEVEDAPRALPDLANLQVRSLNAQRLLAEFREKYGAVLELLVERGSFVQGEDLSPVWDMSWPGVDELMSILEIQRLFRQDEVDRVVVDMAPSGHTLNLFGLMDFLDSMLDSLNLFQEKHRVISQSFTGRYAEDNVDQFLNEIREDLAAGRALLQNPDRTACVLVAIPEPMSWLETRRFVEALGELQVPFGGIVVNHWVQGTGDGKQETGDRRQETGADSTPEWALQLAEQWEIWQKFQTLAPEQPVFTVPQQEQEPVGMGALDQLLQQVTVPKLSDRPTEILSDLIATPAKVPPGFPDFITEGRKLIIVGGKGGVGKTTVSAAIAWGMATRHTNNAVQVISIDPAHSLGDAFGQPLGHVATDITANLSAQEVDADQVLDRFRDDYLWELAEMMSGDNPADQNLTLAYGPEAWRQIVSQALPGIDEMLSLITVMELLEQKQQDLIILDTAPTGHLLRFLEMPTALADWLAWIFKLWIKYQDVVGRVDLIGRLRTLRQRVMQAQKKLKDPEYTEFISVFQAQSAIVAETERLNQAVQDMGIPQRYVVQNRYRLHQPLPDHLFPAQTIVPLPWLLRGTEPLKQIEQAADLLF
jgi:arsenite-transporting ATPase